jgi:hypothetical protein
MDQRETDFDRRQAIALKMSEPKGKIASLLGALRANE